MKKHKKPLTRSIIIGCIIFLILLSALMSVGNLLLHRNYVYNNFQKRITYMLNYTLDHIDADDLKQCIETKEKSEKYKTTQLFMDSIIDNYDDIHYFYAVVPLNYDDTGNVMSVLSAERYYDRYVDTEGNLYLGWISDDEYDKETTSLLFDIMNDDEITFFEEQTEWGTDYTGAIAVKDSSGNGICVLCVDIDISFINQSVFKYAMVNLGIVIGFGCFFTVLFLLWAREHITKPIKKLEESAVGFVDHSSNQRDVSALKFDAPVIRFDNEIKSLSDAVTKMTEDMKDYVADIINAEEEAANMHELANKDALTGVKNKLAYFADINNIKDTKVGIAICDLNFLKKLNDTHGHDKGDIAIKKMSEMVCNIFCHSPVYRIGGDEFAIILKNHDYDHYHELEAMFNKEMEKMAKDDTLKPWEKISAAIGVAFFEDGDDMETVFKRADQNMYKRKSEMKAIRTE